MSEVIPKPLPNRRLSLCDQRGRPAVLLEAEVLGTRLNRLVIGDAIQQPHDLDPSPKAPQLAATPWGGSPPRPLCQKICYSDCTENQQGLAFAASQDFPEVSYEFSQAEQVRALG